MTVTDPREGEEPLFVLRMAEAATVVDLRRLTGLFGVQLWDTRFNIPTGDGTRLGDMKDENKDVFLEVRRQRGWRASRARSSVGAPPSSDTLSLVVLVGAVAVSALVATQLPRCVARWRRE